MQVNSLSLRQFANHPDTSRSLPRCALFAGQVGVGKSSVIDALAMLFAGRTRLCDGKGTGAGDYIRHGATEFSITAEVIVDGNGLLLERTRSEKANCLSGFPAEKSGVEAQQAALLKALNTRVDLLLAVLDSKPLLARTEKEQRAEVLAVVQPGVAALPLSPDRKAQLLKLLRVASIATLEECARLYENAYKLRTKANQERDTFSRNLPERPEAVKAEFGITTEGALPSRTGIERDIAGYRRQVKELEAQRTQANSVTETLARLRAWPDVTPETPTLLADPLPPQYESEEVVLAEVKRFESEAELEVRAVNARKLSEQVVRLNRAVSGSEVGLGQLRQQLGTLKNLAADAPCPCCRRKMTAKAQAEQIRSLEISLTLATENHAAVCRDRDAEEARFNAAMADDSILRDEKLRIEATNRAAIESAERFAREASKRNEQRRGEYNRTVKQTVEANAQTQAQYDRTAKVAAERKAQIENLEAQAQEAHAALPEIQKEIAALDCVDVATPGRIQRAEQALVAVTRIEDATQRWIHAHAEYQAAEAKATELDALVAWLGPKGLPAELFSEWSQPFIAKMQSVLDRFGYGKLIVEAEADQPFRFLLQRAGGTVVASHLSSGQQLIFELAYREALAELSGLGIVCLDAASNLGDGEAISALCESCRVSKAQFIVTVTTERLSYALELARKMQAQLFWFRNREDEAADIVTDEAEFLPILREQDVELLTAQAAD